MTTTTEPPTPQAPAVTAAPAAPVALPVTDAEGATLLRAADAEPLVIRCRDELLRRGVRPGDRVVLLAANSAEFAAALLALVALDASIVLADHQQTPEQALQTLIRARVRWAVTDTGDPATPMGAALTGALPAGRVIDLTASCRPAFPGAAGPGAAHPVTPHPVTPHPVTAGPDTAAAPDPVSFERWRARRDGLVLWSSGSTGRPKGIVRSGAAMLVNTEATQRAMRYRRDDVLLPLLPFSHQYGMSLVLLWWQTRGSLLIAPYHRLTTVAGLIGRYGVTVVDAAPPTYHALLQVFERRPALLGPVATVRMWCVGGAPLPAPLAERFRAAVGLPLLDGYGLSELGNVALAVPERPRECGQPLEGVRLRIDRPVDGVGEVLVDSPGLMSGYLTDEGGLRPVEPGWFRTGDLGRIDPDGSLQVIGRNQAVHRMGYTLYPESLRRQAERCGRPVAVVAVEDERRGCRVVFFVEDPALRDARHWRARFDDLLAPYERPNLVEVVERFPLTRTGKVDRVRLTATAAERLGVRRSDGEPS
ncbi:class I adenylate-forming enzyme family protein [Kitasatospora sp. NPDC004240]